MHCGINWNKVDHRLHIITDGLNIQIFKAKLKHAGSSWELLTYYRMQTDQKWFISVDMI